MDDIDWYGSKHSGGQPTAPDIVSRHLDLKDVPDNLVEDIIRHVVVRAVCPHCKDTSFYYAPHRGHRHPPDCQGGCGTTLLLG